MTLPASLNSRRRGGSISEFLDKVLPLLRTLGGAQSAQITTEALPESATVLQRLLPGHAGFVVLVWADALPSSADRPLLYAAVDIVVTAVMGRHAESELADLVQRVDGAQQLAAMGDYDWHIASDTNRWSDQLYRIYGHEPQTFNASYERFLSFLHPDDRDRIQAIHQEAFATGEPYRMVERIVRADGELRFLFSNGQVVRDADGVPVRMRGTCIDITDRVIAEEERERVSDRFRLLVDACPEAVLLIDGSTRIMQANPRATDLLERDPIDALLAEVLTDPARSGQAIEATSLAGNRLLLDVVSVELSASDLGHRFAVFLTDASTRLDREDLVKRVSESRQRRRQALEINDSVVQGLSAAQYSLESGNAASATEFIAATLASARNMMDDLLEPNGTHLVAGDLVLSSPATIERVGR
jgi:PAS domain S-box-containing protein